MSKQYDIQTYIYSYLLDKEIYLPTTPTNISRAHTATYEQTAIPGRSEPYLTYVGGGVETFTYSLYLHDDLVVDYTSGVSNLDSLLKELKSLTYPNYSEGTVEQHLLYIKVGNTVGTLAYCNQVSITYEGAKRDNRYISATVQLTFNAVNRQALSADDVAR